MVEVWAFVSQNIPWFFSGGGIALIGVVVWWYRRQKARQDKSPSQSQRLDVIPLWFEMHLNQQIPFVAVHLLAVNYFKKELVLDGVTVSYLHMSDGPPIERIDVDDYAVPRLGSREITCRRPLQDSEVKAFRNIRWRDRFDAHLRLRAKGRAGRRSVRFDHLANFSIHGWVYGLASEPRS